MKIVRDYSNRFKKWAPEHIAGLVVINFTLMFLFLLRSAGYFAPYFPISINVIVLILLIFTNLFLGLKSNFIFFVSIFFLLLAGILKTIGIDIWAERSAVYAFQAILVGTVLMILEYRSIK